MSSSHLAIYPSMDVLQNIRTYPLLRFTINGLPMNDGDFDDGATENADTSSPNDDKDTSNVVRSSSMDFIMTNRMMITYDMGSVYLSLSIDQSNDHSNCLLWYKFETSVVED